MNFLSNHRPILCRSEFQPNLLEYIDTTLNESFRINRTVSNDGRDQFGNTILDQYLLYLLCQKIDKNRREFYQILHRLIVQQSQISKGFFEYSPPSVGHQRSIYERNFRCYTNFIWNEFSVNTLLEIGSFLTIDIVFLLCSFCHFSGCFLLKYRLDALFLPSCDPHGFFLEILIIYYLSTHQTDSFLRSRSINMIFPSPSRDQQRHDKPDERQTFQRFLRAFDQNAELTFDREKIFSIFQRDSFQFLQRKLSNEIKRDFLTFLQNNDLLSRRQPRSLKSLCRQMLKIRLNNYPDDIDQLNCSKSLRFYLRYENFFF